MANGNGTLKTVSIVIGILVAIGATAAALVEVRSYADEQAEEAKIAAVAKGATALQAHKDVHAERDQRTDEVLERVEAAQVKLDAAVKTLNDTVIRLDERTKNKKKR